MNAKVEYVKAMSDITNYWLYSDLRDIIVLESLLEKVIKFLISLENDKDEILLTKNISTLRDTCYTIHIIQRTKLIEFFCTKISENFNDNNHYKNLRSALIFTYGLFFYSYQDHNKLSKEIFEIKKSVKYIESKILSKVVMQIDSDENLSRIYLFCLIIVQQIQLWFEWNQDSELDKVELSSKIRKPKDKVTKALLSLSKELSKPLKEVSMLMSKSFDQILISSFMGFTSRKDIKSLYKNVDLKSDSNKCKRKIDEKNLQSPKRFKSCLDTSDIKSDLESENMGNICQKLSNLIELCTFRNESNIKEIIEFLKSTPEIVLRCQKSINNDDSDCHLIIEQIHLILIKLWNKIITSGSINMINVDLYFSPIITWDIKESKNIRLIILEILAFVISFQSQKKLQIISNPFWILELLIGCLEGVLYKSTINLEYSPNQRLELSDLVSEIGKVIEILLRPQDKESWCRIIVLVPQRLFSFIANLDNPIHQDVTRTLKKTVIAPIIQMTNKFAFKQMTTLVKGAGKEICKDLLEIK